MSELLNYSSEEELKYILTANNLAESMEILKKNVYMRHIQPDMSKIPGGCVAQGMFENWEEGLKPKVKKLSNGTIVRIKDAIYDETIDGMKEFYLRQGAYSPVGVQGMQGGDGKVGSNRITCWDPQFALEMWRVILPFVDCKICDYQTSTDWWQISASQAKDTLFASIGEVVRPVSSTWRPVGVTPMVRFMNYQEGGEHYAHYDAGHIYKDPRFRTLMSGVLYLTSNSTGKTRFIRDGQSDQAVWDRDHSDHQARTLEESVETSLAPEKGSILLFDHRLCHDVSLYDGAEGDRTIIRFDVVFEAL